MVEALYRVEQLAGRPIVFMKGDVTQESDLEDIFEQYKFWAVIHFAAIKVNCLVIYFVSMYIYQHKCIGCR